MTRTGVEIRVDLETCKIKGTRSTVSFSVMTHRTKNVGHQKRNLLTKFQLSTENPLITTCPNRCENWVFLNFLEIESSYYTDSENQRYGQQYYTHVLCRTFFDILNPMWNRYPYRCENWVFLILLETGWSYREKSEGKVGDIQKMNNFYSKAGFEHETFSNMNPQVRKIKKT